MLKNVGVVWPLIDATFLLVTGKGCDLGPHPAFLILSQASRGWKSETASQSAARVCLECPELEPLPMSCLTWFPGPSPEGLQT